jgi:hypothetical protein
MATENVADFLSGKGLALQSIEERTEITLVLPPPPRLTTHRDGNGNAPGGRRMEADGGYIEAIILAFPPGSGDK